MLAIDNFSTSFRSSMMSQFRVSPVFEHEMMMWTRREAKKKSISYRLDEPLKTANASEYYKKVFAGLTRKSFYRLAKCIFKLIIKLNFFAYFQIDSFCSILPQSSSSQNSQKIVDVEISDEKLSIIRRCSSHFFYGFRE